MGDNRKENTMNTTDNFARNYNDALRKVLRKFTVTDSELEPFGSKSYINTRLSYKKDDDYSVSLVEVCDVANCNGLLLITVYKSHPEWGVSILAENECRYEHNRAKILARELMECVGIIETHSY